MTGLEIVPVGPGHGWELLDAWFDTYQAAQLATGPGVASPFQREELRAHLSTPSTIMGHYAALGSLRGTPVVAGYAEWPLRDNLDQALVDVSVAPGRRRAGFGSLMLAHLEQVVRDHDRHVVGAEVPWAYDAGPRGAGAAGPMFAAARGFALALSDVKRRLPLPVAPTLLDELGREAAPHHPAYVLRGFVGPVPEDLIESWSELVSLLLIEAPTGDRSIEAERVDPERVREADRSLARQGRTRVATVALDEDGCVVAYTEVCVTEHEPDRAYQWGTLVRRDVRGHRLGMAVKVANLRQLQERFPDLTMVLTYNAEVNEAMIGINERLGFTAVARLGEFEKRLP